MACAKSSNVRVRQSPGYIDDSLDSVRHKRHHEWPNQATPLPSKLTYPSEFFGTARFTHPIPASVSQLSTHFPNLSCTHKPNIFPSPNGETIPALHDRYAYALHRIIASLDREGGREGGAGPKAALLCTHAAGMICIGRVLTGRMPEKEEEEDFKCGTCSLSVFQRRIKSTNEGQKQEEVEKEEEGEIVEDWDENQPDHIPRVAWRDGKGVAGGWECVLNGSCEHLRNGEERAW